MDKNQFFHFIWICKTFVYIFKDWTAKSFKNINFDDVLWKMILFSY